MFSEMIAHYSKFIFWFAFFGVFHSVAAQDGFKKILSRLTHPHFVLYYWRVIYCLASLYLLYGPAAEALIQASAKYPNPLWTYSIPAQTTVRVLYLGGVLICYTAFIQSDYLSFVGLKQLWSGLKTHFTGTPNKSSTPLFGTDRLVINGIYRWVRHPMLLGALIMFSASTKPTAGTIVLVAMVLIYITAGVYFEEKRLVNLFGSDYVRYQKSVGAFLPRVFTFVEKKGA